VGERARHATRGRSPGARRERGEEYPRVVSDTSFQRIGDLPLRHGGILRDVEIAYVTRGSLAPDARNALLLTHGYTSSHHFADPEERSPGSWASLVGPGRAIDTDRFFVISSNMLGSSHGSTIRTSCAPSSR
jgi:homoserine O-acetyltransferase/O-succinyltransferase